ncbi:Imidazoleglycerol-phosphate synthase [Butyrivibrio fibrisolvens 16/4]|nr:Imidazoleglycerol-phosphate synthase [Butyrivibrio fibrisolvens 16/4]
MEHKNIVATIYLKDGMAVKSPTELDNKKDVLELASVYDDSGIDKIICYDLSTDDEEHEKNILAIREINRNVQVKTAGGGNIKRLEDVKKFLYAGCVEVILNGSKPETIDLIKEASARFGSQKMLVSLATVDFYLRQRISFKITSTSF